MVFSSDGVSQRWWVAGLLNGSWWCYGWLCRGLRLVEAVSCGWWWVGGGWGWLRPWVCAVG